MGHWCPAAVCSLVSLFNMGCLWPFSFVPQLLGLGYAIEGSKFWDMRYLLCGPLLVPWSQSRLTLAALPCL
jgi:hypothetical protein